MLLDDPVVLQIGERSRQAVGVAIALGDVAVDVEPAELGDHQVGIGRAVELDRDVRFETRDVGLFHGAAEVDHDPAIGLLEIDQPWKHPEIARSLRNRDTHRALRIGRKRCAAEDIEAQALHLFHVEQQGFSLVAERQSRLIAQKKLEPQFFLEPVNLPHQCGAGQSEDLRCIPEALVPRAEQKCAQVFPRCIGSIFDFLALRECSTPMQMLRHTR
jgi:hypothetical protein